MEAGIQGSVLTYITIADAMVNNCNTWSMTYLWIAPCSFENGRIDHFTDLLNDLHNRYYKYWQICDKVGQQLADEGAE